MIRTEFDFPSDTQQYIAALEVPMDDTVLMQMLQAPRYVPTHSCDVASSHQVRRNNIRERATFNILHHHPELILIKVRLDIVDDIYMTRSLHYEDLIHDTIRFRLLTHAHLIDRNRKIRHHLVGSEHTTRGAT